jgi:pimeloyl-ACP methyl ester carboxylesterase
MRLEDWKSEGEFFDYKGNAIFYRRGGKRAGEVLLLLHGFPTASFDWHKLWPDLIARFSCLAYDYIGYGFSAKPRQFDYTTFAQVDLLEALLAHLNVKRVHVLSHDYGNTITQELQARRGRNSTNVEILSWCMLNGALFPETHRPILAQKILISPLGFLFERLISDGKFSQSLASVFGQNTQPSAEEMRAFVTLFRHNNGRGIAHKLIRYMRERAIHRERWVAPLTNGKIPMRMINGLADRVSGAHLVKRLREVAPGFDIVELPGIGHYPQIECPEKVLKGFIEFNES